MNPNPNCLAYYAYPIQFTKNTEEATTHLARFIADGACGYNRGKSYYTTELKSLLDSEIVFIADPIPGFPFQPYEFRQILFGVIQLLDSTDSNSAEHNQTQVQKRSATE